VKKTGTLANRSTKKKGQPNERGGLKIRTFSLQTSRHWSPNKNATLKEGKGKKPGMQQTWKMETAAAVKRKNWVKKKKGGRWGKYNLTITKGDSHYGQKLSTSRH